MKKELYKILNYKQPYENGFKISLISKYSELTEILNVVENKTKSLKKLWGFLAFFVLLMMR